MFLHEIMRFVLIVFFIEDRAIIELRSFILISIVSFTLIINYC